MEALAVVGSELDTLLAGSQLSRNVRAEKIRAAIVATAAAIEGSGTPGEKLDGVPSPLTDALVDLGIALRECKGA